MNKVCVSHATTINYVQLMVLWFAFRNSQRALVEAMMTLYFRVLRHEPRGGDEKFQHHHQLLQAVLQNLGKYVLPVLAASNATSRQHADTHTSLMLVSRSSS